MLRTLLCVALLAGLSLNAGASEKGEQSDKGKVPEAAKKDAAKKVEPAKKSEPTKELAVPTWVPKQFLGTPIAKRLAKIQAELDEANAKRGPAREEAQKARSVANLAEHKANDLDRLVKSLESEKWKVVESGNKHLREFALDKADIEHSDKITRLEAQVRDLTARLDAATKKQVNKQPEEKQPAKK
jgi:hypothetical protein